MRGRGFRRGDGTGDARHLGLKGRARAALDGGGYKAGHDIEHGGDGGGSGLGAKHSGERVGGAAAGAGGHDVADGLVQLVGGTLDALEILAQGAGDGLVDGVDRIGVVRHAALCGQIGPFCDFGR